MKTALLFLLGCALAPSAMAADNLKPFTGIYPHPVCGINPQFDDRQRNMPLSPFASCRTLVLGAQVEKSYPDPGTEAMGKLIMTIAETSGWEKMFGPLSRMPMNCRPNLPLGLGPLPNTPGADWPVCSVAFVRDFLIRYNRQGEVIGFKKFERSLSSLDLSMKENVAKLQLAEAAVRAAGGSASFDDIAELLQ